MPQSTVGICDTPIIRPADCSRVWMSGDEYTILLDSAASGGAMTTISASVPPGGGPPIHLHLDVDELFVVLDGEVQIYVDGNSYNLTSGEQIFVGRGVPHSFTNMSTNTVRMLLVYTPSGIENFFLAAGAPVRNGESPPPSTPESLTREIAVAARFNTIPPSSHNATSPPRRSDYAYDVIGDDTHGQ